MGLQGRVLTAFGLLWPPLAKRRRIELRCVLGYNDHYYSVVVVRARAGPRRCPIDGILRGHSGSRSRILSMCNLLDLATKLLVWTVAVLVPLQPLSTVGCCCASSSRQESDADERQPPADPCSLITGNCCERSLPERRCCCEFKVPAPTGCSCTSTGVCSCTSHNSPCPGPQAPPKSDRQTVHVATQPPAGVSWSFDRHRGLAAASHEVPSSMCSGWERCIALCRFTL